MVTRTCSTFVNFVLIPQIQTNSGFDYLCKKSFFWLYELKVKFTAVVTIWKLGLMGGSGRWVTYFYFLYQDQYDMTGFRIYRNPDGTNKVNIVHSVNAEMLADV